MYIIYMFKRELTESLKGMAQKYPVVTLIGPRQSGKTTLACQTFPEYRYVNLEQTSMRLMAKEDPRGFLASNPPPLIIDEVQRCPELLSEIQVVSDSLNRNGAFILTGSQQLTLMQGVSQTLAGRTSILTLLPLSLRELALAGIEQKRDECLYFGGMPRIFDSNIEPNIYYRDYFRTYVERDVRDLIRIRDFDRFDIFVKLLAGRVGQILNTSSLAADVGVSNKTIAEWISVLEISNVVFKLRPWFGNVGKRLTKSPKIYFTDTGLAARLLGIETPEQVARDPLHGNLFENLVILETLKSAWNQNMPTEFFYFRTESGTELDLLFKSEGCWNAVEIKSSSTVNTDYFKNFTKVASIPEFESMKKILVYSGDNIENFKGCRCVNYKDAGKIVGR